MQIKEFPNLINNEETSSHCLKNCSVVIDANNFFYNTYENDNLPFVFGSEANRHAATVRKVLKKFKDANVKCYFVFKGGTDNITKKLKKSKRVKFDLESKYKFVPPIFLKEVYKQVLEEEGESYATSIMECKDDCVALAQQLGCSVLSKDTEFCFKKAPYIPYTTLKYTSNAIKCRQYKIENFLYKHALTHKKFAIFAVLNDTNFIPSNHFRNLFKSWGVIHQNIYFHHKQLLKYLSDHSEDEIVTSVLNFLRDQDQKQQFLKAYQKILTTMRNEKDSVVADYLYNGSKLDISCSDPLWFEKGVATQNIDIPYIDLCKHNIISGSAAIEKQGSTESLMLSIDIIKYAFNLLTDYQASEFSIYQYAKIYVKENASDFNIRKPPYSGSGLVFQTGWQNIKRMKLFEHFLSENDINTDTINKLPEEVRVLIIALTYFARKKGSEREDVTKLAYCFIVCHVLLRVVHDREESLRKKSSGISEHDSAEAIRVTEKYFRFDKEEAKRIYDEDKLKTMVELQLCLAHMNYLNTLCGAPYKPTVYHRSFNGTFVYQLWHHMSEHDHTHFIHKLFQAAPSAYNYIISLVNIYHELV